VKRLICSIYRSRRKRDVYLYVNHEMGFSEVPDALLKELGGLDKAMTLVLTPERKLARMTGAEVMEAVAEKGFYLQMPPPDGFEDALC